MNDMEEHELFEFLGPNVSDLRGRDSHDPMQVRCPLNEGLQVEIRGDGVEFRLGMLCGRHRGGRDGSDHPRSPETEIVNAAATGQIRLNMGGLHGT